MGRSQETFGKKEREKKKAKKRQEKLARKEERKEKPKASLDDMITYVDEYGRPTDTPPDPMKKTVIKTEDIQISIPKKEELPEEDLTRSGKVEFFNHDKGFGFIRDAEVNEKYFTHTSFTQSIKHSIALVNELTGFKRLLLRHIKPDFNLELYRTK